MSSLLKDYKVEFLIPLNIRTKRLLSISPWLTQFIGDYNSIYTAESLFSEVNKVLSGQNTEWTGISQSEQVAKVTLSETKIFEDLAEYSNNPAILPVYTLPTAHFKEIVEAWKNYLEQ